MYGQIAEAYADDGGAEVSRALWQLTALLGSGSEKVFGQAN